jgi:hypothetical protein
MMQKSLHSWGTAMPHLYTDVDKLNNQPPVGTGSCVDLIKIYVPGLKSRTTHSWKPGENVMEAFKAGKTFPRGTAIATFIGGRYPQADRPGESTRHAALLLDVQQSGILVMDQFPSRLRRRNIEKRFIAIPPRWVQPHTDGTPRNAGNNALTFHVIE